MIEDGNLHSAAYSTQFFSAFRGISSNSSALSGVSTMLSPRTSLISSRDALPGPGVKFVDPRLREAKAAAPAAAP